MGLDRPGITPTAKRKKVKRVPVKNPTGRSVGRAITKASKHKAPAKFHGSADIGTVNPVTKIKVGVIKPRGTLDTATHAVSRELSGDGVIVKSVGKAAKFVGEHGVGISTGGGPAGLVSAHSAKSGNRTAAVIASKPYRLKDAPVLRAAVEDAINFPAQAIPSVYVPVAGVVEAAKGHPKRIKKFAHDLATHDPVYATVEAGVRAATGDTKGAGKAIRKAGTSIKEHPGFAAIEAIGVKGTAGRAVTKAQELAGKNPTARPSATEPGTNLVQQRSYSRDASTRAIQKGTDRRRAAAATKLRQESGGDPAQLALANRKDPTIISDAEIRRRADQRVHANETVRRGHRTVVAGETKRAISNTQRPQGSPAMRVATRKANRQTKIEPSAATVLATQAITPHPTVRHLTAYRDEIAAQHDALPPAQAVANRELRKQIDKAIAQRADPAALKAASDRYAAVMRPLQQGLVDRGLIAAGKVDKAALVPYAIRHMDDVHAGPHGPVHVDGSPVSAAAIRAHMAEHGVKEPAYVTQAPGQRGARNFFVSSGRPPSVMGQTRTGAATAKGTFDAHPDVLAEGAAKAQGLIDAADGFTQTIHEFAHQPSLGKIKTRQEADGRARTIHAETGQVFMPVRVNPFGGSHEQLQSLLDSATHDVSGEASPVLRDAMQSALRGEDGPGPWALLPKAAVDQLNAHLHSLGVGPKAKALQVVGSGFRRTVLATSPTWMTGNVVESVGRASLMRAGPRSLVTGRRVLKAVDRADPAAGEALRARAVGGGHFAMADRQHMRRDSSQFAGSTVLEPLARGLGAFWRAPGPKQAAGAWHAWTDIVFNQVNGRFESSVQTAMLGKALRDSPLMDNAGRKTGQVAVDQAARGLRNTNEQAAFAKIVERAYGKYSAFAPDTRWAIATYTPFIAWTLNAVKFATDVLPRDHPTVTALIVASEQATQEWRHDHGLDLFMKGALPGFLQGSIPTSGGGHQRAPFRYTPFGAFGDPVGTVGNAVLPQFSGVLAAFRGEDWKGKKLTKPDGSPEDQLGLAKAAAGSFVDATVPIYAVAKRVAKKGPGALNPIAPVAPAKAKVRRSGGRARTAEQDIQSLGGADQTMRDIQNLGNIGP